MRLSEVTGELEWPCLKGERRTISEEKKAKLIAERTVPFQTLFNKLMYNSQQGEQLSTLTSRKSCCQVAGLKNIGNTCFINCTLQALASSENFQGYIRKVQASLVGISNGEVCEALHEVLTLLKPRLLDVDTKSKHGIEKAAVIDTTKLFNKLKSSSSCSSLQGLGNFEQQDADEFLHFLFSSVEEEIVKLKRSLYRNRQSKVLLYALGSRQTIPQFIPRNPFAGLLLSQKTCLKCTTKSPFAASEFSVLSVALVSRFGTGIIHHSVYDALDEFTTAETIDGVLCESCNGKRQVQRKLLIGRMPKVFCLHLKRKYYNSQLNCFQKIDIPISFPTNLDLTPYMFYNTPDLQLDKRCNRGENFTHTLSAVVEHHGSVSGGHFTTYRRVCREKWFYTSDEKVLEIDENQVSKANLYYAIYDQR